MNRGLRGVLALLVTVATAAEVIGGWLVVLRWLGQGSLFVVVCAMLAVVLLGVGMAYVAVRVLVPR